MHVFFDLDNTLWDFDANSKETLSELFDEFSLDGLTGVTKEYFIQRYFFQNDRYWDLYRQNRVSKARLRSIRFEVTLRDIGIDNKSLARQVGKAYLEQCPLKSNLIEGAEEVIKALHGSHQLHVLSNGFQDTQILKLKSCSMHSYFDHVITSERANARKPQQKMFDFAMNKTSSKTEDCVLIGDKVEIDVLGAINAGWRGIHYNPNHEIHSHESISKLTELIPLFLK